MNATAIRIYEIVRDFSRGKWLEGREVVRLFELSHGKRVSYGRLYTHLRRLEEAGMIMSRMTTDSDGKVKLVTADPDAVTRVKPR